MLQHVVKWGRLYRSITLQVQCMASIQNFELCKIWGFLSMAMRMPSSGI